MILTILNPLADIEDPEQGKKSASGGAITPLMTLEGGRMGLLWNQHASTVEFWPVLGQVAEATLGTRAVERINKASTWNPAPPETIAELAGNVDYVLVGVGACGSCTTCSVRDCVNLLRAGIPAVILVHEPFEKLARIQFEIQRVTEIPGVSVAPLLVYERDLIDRESTEMVIAKARAVIDRAAAMLLGLGK